MAFCTNCGKQLPEGQRFCTECGTPLRDEAEPVMAAVTGAETEPAAEEAAPASSPAPEPVFDSEPVPEPVYTAPQPVPEPAPAPQPVYAAPQPAPRPAYTAPQPQPQPVYAAPQPQPVYAPAAPASEIPAKGSKYDTISTGGFIGIFLLMCIPIVGLILMIVWACGGCRKLTKRNMARAMLIFLAVSLILSFVLGLVFKDRIGRLMEQYGVSGSDISSIIAQGGVSGQDAGALGGLVSSLLGGEGGGILGGLTGENGDVLSGLAGENGDALNGLTGENGAGGIDELMEGASQLQQDAEAMGSGWPSSLPRYPYGGSAEEVTSYRTEVADTTREEMLAYVDTLKASGYAYKDLYDFGFDEETMLNDFNGWQGTDGRLYIGVSFSEGTVTIDYLNELPSLEDYF